MKTLLFTVKKSLHDKLANQSKEKKMWRPDFFAHCIEVGSEVIQKRLDQEFQHDLACELANEILRHVDTDEGNHKFDIDFKFKGNPTYANGEVGFIYNGNELLSVEIIFEMLMFNKDDEEIDFVMPDSFDVADLIKKFV